MDQLIDERDTLRAKVKKLEAKIKELEEELDGFNDDGEQIQREPTFDRNDLD